MLRATYLMAPYHARETNPVTTIQARHAALATPFANRMDCVLLQTRATSDDLAVRIQRGDLPIARNNVLEIVCCHTSSFNQLLI